MERMNIAIVGHVDHGKSTIIGRLLADTGSLPEGKLEQVKKYCEKNSRPFEYAYLLDALKDEQAQGITIDTARCFFKTKKRYYLILDAPGHVEFLKNMLTGAAHAEAALVVIDAAEGIQSNSYKHGYLLSLLGIKDIVVCVNKMDMVDYDQKIFEDIKRNYTKFLKSINLKPLEYIPIASRDGDNIVQRSEKINWYKAKTVIESLDSFKKENTLDHKPLRIYIQDIYKFTSYGDNRRIYTGKIESGTLKVGDEITFLPLNKKSKVKRIEKWNANSPHEAGSGFSVGFTLEEQIYVRRGALAYKKEDTKKPYISSKFKARLFWFGKVPLLINNPYILKIGTNKVKVKVIKIDNIVSKEEVNTKEIQGQIERHSIAECILQTDKPIVFDLTKDIENTSRFVIIDKYKISGCGIITESLEDELDSFRKETLIREMKFEKGEILLPERIEKYKQTAKLILIVSDDPRRKKELAKKLEKRLFEKNKLVYYMGMANIKYSVVSNMISGFDTREEIIRHLGEVIYLMLDAGLILVVTSNKLNDSEKKILEILVSPYKILDLDIDKDEKKIVMKKNGDIDINSTLDNIERWLEENK